MKEQGFAVAPGTHTLASVKMTRVRGFAKLNGMNLNFEELFDGESSFSPR